MWLTIDDEPEPEPGGIWEEHQEVRLDIRDGLYLTSPTADNPFWDPVYTPTAPGPHAVTVYARGRSAQPDIGLAPDAEPTEEFLVTIKPAKPPQSD